MSHDLVIRNGTIVDGLGADPFSAHDLPGGGRRLDQSADSYVATVVSGEVIAEHGAPTSARPGRLIRGRRPAPVV